MNKKFFIAWIVVFVAWMAGSFVVHGVLLHDDYLRLPNLFRTEADAQRYASLVRQSDALGRPDRTRSYTT